MELAATETRPEISMQKILELAKEAAGKDYPWADEETSIRKLFGNDPRGLAYITFLMSVEDTWGLEETDSRTEDVILSRTIGDLLNRLRESTNSLSEPQKKGMMTQVRLLTLEDLQTVWDKWRLSIYNKDRKFGDGILTLDTRPIEEFKLSGYDQIDLSMDLEDVVCAVFNDEMLEPLRFSNPTIQEILDTLNSYLQSRRVF